MNRIQISVEKIKAESLKAIEKGVSTEEEFDENRKKLDFSLKEYVRFQELKSLAVASGKLNLEEGNTIYQYLGNSLETFNRQPFEVKYVLTQVFMTLLKRAA